MLGDSVCACGWASGVELDDRRRHLVLELLIVAGASFRVALSTAGSCRLVGETFGLGVYERRLLNQDSLSLVAAAGTAEPDDHGGEAAASPRSPGQCGVA